MKLHVVIRTFFLCICCVSSCKKQDTALMEEIMEDQTQIVQLQQELRLSAARWDRLMPLQQEAIAIERQCNELERHTEEAQQKREDLIADIESLTRKQSQYENDLANHRNGLRSKAVGQRYETFFTKDRVYQQVTITAVQAQGIVMEHRDGIARISVEDLSDQQLLTFGLDRDQANIARKEEHRQQMAYFEWIDTEIEKKPKEANAPVLTSTTIDFPKASTYSYSKPSLLRQTPQNTSYRVRNQGRSRYYYVYPSCYDNSRYYHRYNDPYHTCPP